MDEQKILQDVQALMVKALDSRRELVAYSRLEALEMDRRARELERETLEEIRRLVPQGPGNEVLHQIGVRLSRMDEPLQELAERQDIQERSRALERDDITWRAFEDISWLLGVG